MKKLFATVAITTAAAVAAVAVTASAHDHAMKGVDVSKTVPENVGMRVVSGYKAHVFADGLGTIRHMAAHKSGWIFAALARPNDNKGAVAMKDTTGDGKADQFVYFAEGLFGTGMTIEGNSLYFGANERIMRYTLSDAGEIAGSDIIVDGLIKRRSHNAKSVTLDGKGGLYVNFGAPSNACMVKGRTKGSPGRKPCDILENFGGIWRFDAHKTNQTKADGVRYTTGIRNAVAVEWNASAKDLFLVQHGRDQLHSFFPEYFSQQQSAELPAEEFHRAQKGDDLGWPYSYYDPAQKSRMVMPEYGGTGKEKADKGKRPIVAFPGHWAPNDLLFPSAKSGLPSGALIAFHGSWNRGKAQRGYRVVFVPMTAAGKVAGSWVTFADGFANPAAGSGEAVNQVETSGKAQHRPMGLAEGTDGSLYISSLMQGGRIWRISHD